MDRIRREIADYNQKVCPVEDLSNGVKRLSPPLSPMPSYPSAILHRVSRRPRRQGFRDLHVGFCRPRVRMRDPKLDPLPTDGMRLAREAEQDNRYRNYRWMYFLGFSVWLGGKLAGATAKLASFNERSVSETRRVLRLFGRGANLLWGALCRGAAALGESACATARLARRIVQGGLEKRRSRSLRSRCLDGQQQAFLDRAIRSHGEVGHTAQAALPAGEVSGGKDCAEQSGGAGNGGATEVRVHRGLQDSCKDGANRKRRLNSPHSAVILPSTNSSALVTKDASSETKISIAAARPCPGASAWCLVRPWRDSTRSSRRKLLQPVGVHPTAPVSSDSAHLGNPFATAFSAASAQSYSSASISTRAFPAACVRMA